MFIIRNQGFFYTDEYYAPVETFKQVVKKTFATKAAAEKACITMVRKWVRSEPIGNYVFDDTMAVKAISKYLVKTWPDEFDGADDFFLHEAEIPKAATDKQVDEIVKLMGVTFAEVFEVDEDEDEDEGEGEGGVDDDDDDDENDDEEADPEEYDEELHYGPSSSSAPQR